MPTEQFTVESVTPIKSGTSKGRDGSEGEWMLFRVVPKTPLDSGVTHFTTFNAEWKGRVGQTVQAEYEVKQNGQYTDHRLIDQKPQRRGGFPVGPGMDKIDSLSQSLDSSMAEII